MKRKKYFERLIKDYPFENGDAGLVYSGDEIDYIEFLNDIKECLGNDKSKFVLMVADESASDPEEETTIIARGQEAIELFYESCWRLFDEQKEDGYDDDSVAIFIKDSMEITNFVYKLCKSRIKHRRRITR